jgi:hypothetical protein
VFDGDPAFGPAWSRYYRLWKIHTGGFSPLHAVWLLREPADFEEARQAVLSIMGQVLKRQPRPIEFLGRLLQALTADPRAASPAAVGGLSGPNVLVSFQTGS